MPQAKPWRRANSLRRACEITPGVPRAALPCGARKEASKRLEFEYAAVLRDRIIELRGK
ncbi:UvrB/UvrC motif-containing protein [Intestinimonas sp. HCP28S3_D6]|uniref:UvrB/UvrC motif-containing protein n=1 Tax=Intestinimonas sp. HCP28S3_D6 TaxID=3438942 RepID=UPI003F88A9EB